MTVIGEFSCVCVSMEATLEEKRIVSIVSSFAKASNKDLRCTDLGPGPVKETS